MLLELAKEHYTKNLEETGHFATNLYCDATAQHSKVYSLSKLRAQLEALACEYCSYSCRGNKAYWVDNTGKRLGNCTHEEQDHQFFYNIDARKYKRALIKGD